MFDQVQMFPGAFVSLFCSSPDKLTAETMSALFTVKFSEQEETTGKESAVVTFWRHYLVECEGTLTSNDWLIHVMIKNTHSKAIQTLYKSIQ